MSKPKVLFVLHLPPPMHGAAMMGKYLKDSTVINSELDAHYINLATNKILSQSGKGSFKKLITFIGLIRQLTSTLRKQKFDLCYVTLTSHGAGFYKDFLIVSIIKLWQRNIIYHFHNKGANKPKTKFADSLYRYVFKDTKSILLSRYLYPDIQQYVDDKNVFYCPNGIPDSNVSTNSETLERATDNQCCQLLFLSNMMREKGIYDLLDACRLINEKGVRFNCHFIGGWLNVTEAEFNHAIETRNLTDIVISHGPKYGEEKQAFFKKSDVFVFPTFYDTFPLVCLEAMQNSLPVVATIEGGIPDIVADGQTGFLVPQHDIEVLAQKITLLIDNRDLRLQMQKAGRKRFLEFFTLSEWEQNMTRILKEAAYKN